METVKEKLQESFEKESSLNHSTYQHIENEKDADGVAWVFVNHHKMVKYPFKFPPLAPYEVRANIAYSGVCHSDCSFVEEHWFPCKYPIAPGHEVLGYITAVGSDVKDFKVGDRVAFGGVRASCGNCEYCKKGWDNICQGDIDQAGLYGDKYWGGYATAIQQPAQWCFKVPESIPDDKAPPLFCAAATCYGPIERYAKPDQNVAILGMGGLGHMGVKIAKAWGCNVTAFTSNEDKVEMAKDLGADKVVHITEESLKEEKGKYHFVLNTITIAYDNFDDLIALTRPLGTFCQVGLPAKENKCKVSAGTLCHGQISFVGSLIASRQEIRDMIPFLAKNNIVPDCEYYDFDHFPDAYKKCLKANPLFRAVVKVKDYKLGEGQNIDI